MYNNNFYYLCNVNLLTKDITYCKGVGTRIASILRSEWKVCTAADLLRKYPYRYVDRSKVYMLSEIRDTETYVQIVGTITDIRTIGEGKGQRLSVSFTDGKGVIELIWFNSKYLRLEKNKKYLLFGKPSLYNHVYNFVQPELTPLQGDTLPPSAQGLQPEYSVTERMRNNGITPKMIRKIIRELLPELDLGGLPETLSEELKAQYHLLDLTTSLKNVHFPENADILARTRERLKFEELFYIQLDILYNTRQLSTQHIGYTMPIVGQYFHFFYNHVLPFTLTKAQQRVIKEIFVDLKSGKQMNRLLQGDVGSGKTLVALIAALIAIDNGYQVCIMAPTEILAQQHYTTISKFLSTMPLHVELLTGSTSDKERKRLHTGLEVGMVNILIGTHALIEPNVVFKNLGLAVIDEQHRFGVVQRAKLWGKNTQPPHILVMTATPIPRTLAMTLYGDLDISVIDELPPGRKNIITLHYTQQQRKAIDDFLQKELSLGRQVYVVFPLIEESDKLPLADLTNGFRYFLEHFPQYKVEYLHGQMPAIQKDDIMRRFKAGEIKILVSTTVIEVGVDVANASLMVIEDAERFGLSQLHQLRGRVGRGAEQSYCLLVTKDELGKDVAHRMDIMTTTNDGFKIAEADLQLRGPGSLSGTLQAGLPFELKIASLASDGQMLEVAKQAATAILDRDPHLDQPTDKIYLDQMTLLSSQQPKDMSEIS